MPLLSTLGALTTFKISDTGLNWGATFSYPSRKIQLGTFVASNNSMDLGGLTPAFPNGLPQYVKLTNITDTVPSISYTASYGSNANVEGTFSDSVYDSVNDRTIFVGRQEANRSGNIIRCGMVRVFNSNTTTYSTFIDPPLTSATSISDRFLEKAVLHSNGTFTASGFLNESGVTPDGYFITNYTQTGTKNWSKLVPNAGPVKVQTIISNNIIITGSDSSNNKTFIATVNSTGTSIVNQVSLTNFTIGDAVAKDTSDNLYLSGAPANIADSQFVKYNYNANSISWAKNTVGPNIFGSVSYYDGNVYVGVTDASFLTNSYINKIVSFDANTGVVNWKNEYRFQGTGVYANTLAQFTKITANADGLFVLGEYYNAANTTFGGAVVLKLPNDGNINGTGTYSMFTSNIGNLTMNIITSNIVIGTASIGLGSANLTLANANAVSTVASTIGANTSQNYTYTTTILK